MEIEFPIEFTVRGTPVSLQARNPLSKRAWKERVKAASEEVLPHPHFASGDRLAVTLYYFPDQPVQGDIDNIVKLVLDALARHIYIDDRQIERLVVQKFEPGGVFNFRNPSPALLTALTTPPALYVRISADISEDLR